jgi:phospholipase C
MKTWIAAVLGILALATSADAARTRPRHVSPAAQMPRYSHVFLIIDENKGYDQLMNLPALTPVIHALATQYGTATQFYAEVHPSEANYIAMLGGDTFGIHDDDAFYCIAGMNDAFCEASGQPGYAKHDIAARSLMEQLASKGLTWKAYLEDIPSAGSLVPRWPTPDYPSAGKADELYAAKHNGFVNFRSVNRAPYRELAYHFVGFGQLDKDLAADTMPAYAHIIPDQCNDMHGVSGPNVPPDCSDTSGLIRRGDAAIGVLVDKIMHSKVWSDPGNSAIVVTFDENNEEERHSGIQGCCGYDAHSKANFGGGHIVTIVITNHGPRHLRDLTPYNHYSLLRTTEAAFGINQYLGHAADTSAGVVTMTPLFAVRP